MDCGRTAGRDTQAPPHWSAKCGTEGQAPRHRLDAARVLITVPISTGLGGKSSPALAPVALGSQLQTHVHGPTCGDSHSPGTAMDPCLTVTREFTFGDMCGPEHGAPGQGCANRTAREAEVGRGHEWTAVAVWVATRRLRRTGQQSVELRVRRRATDSPLHECSVRFPSRRVWVATRLQHLRRSRWAPNFKRVCTSARAATPTRLRPRWIPA